MVVICEICGFRLHDEQADTRFCSYCIRYYRNDQPKVAYRSLVEARLEKRGEPRTPILHSWDIPDIRGRYI